MNGTLFAEREYAILAQFLCATFLSWDLLRIRVKRVITTYGCFFE